jgi:hypothetical protein
MSFFDDIGKSFQLNIVIVLNGDVYGQYQPDSGLVIEDERLGLIVKSNISGAKVDIRKTNSSTPSLSFELLDKDGFMSSEIMKADGNFLETPVQLYIGEIRGPSNPMDFGDYIKYTDTIVKSINKVANGYVFKCAELVNLLKFPIFQIQSTLATPISDTATTAVLVDAAEFPVSGRFILNDEVIQYNGKTGNILNNLSRGDLNSTANDHDQGDAVFFLERFEENPLTGLLQIMLSDAGDLSNGPYDVLTTGGLGIDQSLVNVANIEAIRDANFQTDNFRFELSNIENAQRFLEEQILDPNNCRFISDNGLINLAVLDQVNIGAVVPEVDETSTLPNERYQLNTQKTVNEIRISYDYSIGLGRYTRTTFFRDNESIARFGVKRLNKEWDFVRADLQGSTIVTNRATRLLSRLSTPRGAISITTHFDKAGLKIGDKILLTNRHLPQQGGGLGISEQLEIISRAVNIGRGQVKFDLEFTSFAGLRLGLIAPSPNPSNIISQTQFEVPDAACYRVGDPLAQNSETGEIRLITDITGNIITINEAFTDLLELSDVLKIPDYNRASSFQHSRYAFISPNPSLTFDDNTQTYSIIF